MGPGAVGVVPSMEIFLRDPSPYLRELSFLNRFLINKMIILLQKSYYFGHTIYCVLEKVLLYPILNFLLDPLSHVCHIHAYMGMYDYI